MMPLFSFQRNYVVDLLFYVPLIVWYSLLCVLSSFAIILTRNRELVALLLLSFRLCLVTVNVFLLFLTVPWVGLHCVIVVFHDHTHLLNDILGFDMLTCIIKSIQLHESNCYNGFQH